MRDTREITLPNGESRKVYIGYPHPPIPDRRFDYSATFEGYEGGDPMGYGPTPEAAIQELIEDWELSND